MEEILIKASQGFSAKLDGEEYQAEDLIRCIIDWPCEVEWNDKFEIKQGSYEDWQWFRDNFLVPNTEVIKEIFSKANKLYRKRLKQEEIFGE